MSSFRILSAVALLPLFVAGCASTGSGQLSRQAQCGVVGAAAGAGTGLLLNGEIIGAVLGAGAGAVMSQIICAKAEMVDGDADGDGVPDSKDKCPDTPAGVAVDVNGCPLDSDGDGVPDHLDKCPNTPAGAPVDTSGCPIDSDGDGVPDHIDACPNTPSGWQVDGRGCPVPLVFRDVTFAFDSAALSDAAKKALDEKVAQTLRDNPAVRIRVIGHTDDVGTEAYNQGLSERRANSVANYLFTRGIVRSRIETAGKGETDPVAPNSVEAGRAANRRVEMFVIK
jgi:OmpA-OmpF porin, OOP family